MILVSILNYYEIFVATKFSLIPRLTLLGSGQKCPDHLAVRPTQKKVRRQVSSIGTNNLFGSTKKALETVLPQFCSNTLMKRTRFEGGVLFLHFYCKNCCKLLSPKSLGCKTDFERVRKLLASHFHVQTRNHVSPLVSLSATGFGSENVKPKSEFDFEERHLRTLV